jgi:hypothetical protein
VNYRFLRVGGPTGGFRRLAFFVALFTDRFVARFFFAMVDSPEGAFKEFWEVVHLEDYSDR